MTKSIIFFDIDGTLLDHNKQLPDSTRSAIRSLKLAGHEIAIASGRSPFMFENLLKELEIDSFVSINGQYVVLRGEVIYKNPLEPELIKSLAMYAAAKDHPLVYTDHQKMAATMDKHVYVETGIASLKLAYPEHDPEYYLDRDIYQVILFCTEDEEDQYKGNFQNLRFVRWHEVGVDVIPVGGSKAYGIEQFIWRLGVPKEEVYAFGDYYNDIEMFNYVGHSVAMGNAPERVKREAKYVTKDVSEDGILYGLKMVGLL